MEWMQPSHRFTLVLILAVMVTLSMAHPGDGDCISSGYEACISDCESNNSHDSWKLLCWKFEEDGCGHLLCRECSCGSVCCGINRMMPNVICDSRLFMPKFSDCSLSGFWCSFIAISARFQTTTV